MSSKPKKPDRKYIRAKEFRDVTGIPDSTRADWENPKSPRHDPTFPSKMHAGSRTVVYDLDEVRRWLEERRKRP